MRRLLFLTPFLLFTAMLSAQSAAPQFVPASFEVPPSYTSPKGDFVLKPLGPKYAKHDYDAYMGSITHLQKTFSFSTRWPNDKITMADAIKDVEGEEAGFKARRKFTYAVLSPDESKELGCVYISPSMKEGYDATVRMWTIESVYKAGFEDKLYAEVKAWLAAKWPFAKVAYIGRDIDREAFRALPNKAK